MRKTSHLKRLILVFVLFWGGQSARADGSFQEELLKKLITATPGSVIELPEGKFQLDSQLSLMVDNVTIKGKGMDKTILSFKGQTNGAEGLFVSASGTLLEDFTIQDTKGDAIKINGADGIVIRRVKVEWTRGPHTDNGAYGFYPVQCQNVLIEDSQAHGASDAGIYVGQSRNIIVRRNLATFNVAGIEIENSIGADVYENTLTNNTGGILVFNMPNLDIKGDKARIFNNNIYTNNTPNFAAPKNTVADVPAGTGIMITANKNVEIFGNRTHDHQTTNILIVSYLVTGRPIDDPNYDPYPEGIFIYDNILTEGGKAPAGGSSESTQVFIELLKQVVGLPFPDIVYDGSFDIKKLENGKVPDALKICIKNPGEGDFINLDALGEFKNMSRDLTPHDCEHPKFPPIVLESQSQANGTGEKLL